jgi:hypothetical protein
VVPVSLSYPAPVSISLSPTWTGTISVVPPGGSAPLLGPVNVTVANAFGAVAAYSNVSSSGVVVLALPVGTYTVSASSFGAPFGIASQASAQSTVRVVNGNVGTTLDLAYQFTYRADVTVVGTDHATVTSPGTAAFAFSARNSGNAPITVHPVGSPAFWRFNFTFSNATLAPTSGGSTLQAGVSILVPAGTAAVHPPVVIDLELANGTVVGSFSPTVNVVAFYGVGVGASPKTATEVGVSSVLVPFYLANTGNIVERVALAVVDQPRVNALGWSVAFRSSSGPLNPPTVSIDAFSNTTYFVNLTTDQAIFVPVGQLTVQASVLNLSVAYQASAELGVPSATVHPGSANGTPGATVTGPEVGATPSTLPDWLVPLLAFVPALALVGGVIIVRWWRSRRWTRR